LREKNEKKLMEIGIVWHNFHRCFVIVEISTCGRGGAW